MQSLGPTDIPFKYRGWAVDLDGGREGARFALESAQYSEALLLGGSPMRPCRPFWLTAEVELADRVNELPKYVVSSTLTDRS
jgi:hypothetical protein